MSSNRRNGNAAEAFVQRLLAAENSPGLVVPLQQDYGADIAVLHALPISLPFVREWTLYEVKSSKIRRRALRARLTPAEAALKERLGERYVVIRVLRIPGPKDRFEVLSRGA